MISQEQRDGLLRTFMKEWRLEMRCLMNNVKNKFVKAFADFVIGNISESEARSWVLKQAMVQ